MLIKKYFASSILWKHARHRSDLQLNSYVYYLADLISCYYRILNYFAYAINYELKKYWSEWKEYELRCKNNIN